MVSSIHETPETIEGFEFFYAFPKIAISTLACAGSRVGLTRESGSRSKYGTRIFPNFGLLVATPPAPERRATKAMAKNVKRIAKKLGARVVGQVPDTGGGAFGMARLAEVLSARLEPSKGIRPGRPSDPSWVHYGKVPMSDETIEKLADIAESVSSGEHKVSPMQVAAQLLEDGIESYSDDR